MKRPLLWMMVAYILGIFTYEVDKEYIILTTFLWCAILFLFFTTDLWKAKKEKYLTGILILLPFFFLLGHIRMNQQNNETQVEKLISSRTEGTAIGTVVEIQCYEDGNAFVLNKVYIKVYNSEDIYNCDKAIVYVTKEDSAVCGNLLSIKGNIYPLTRASNPGQFDQYNYYKSKNISVKIYPKQIEILNNGVDPINHPLFLLKEQLKESYKRLIPEKQSGILIAMLLGDKELLADDMKEQYQENGISHILAISGLHMSFFGLTIFKLLRKARCSIIFSTILVILLILCYGVLTNNSISAKRALIMLILFLLSSILGKTYDLLSALSFSAILQLLETPMQLFQASFALSYGAMLGIAIIYPIFKSMNIIPNKPIIKGILEGFFVSLSVQIITLPIVLHFFYEITPYSVILNILVVPLLSILFPMAVIAGILSFISLPVASFSMGIVYYILIVYETLCDFFGKLPYHLYLLGKPSVSSIVFFYFMVALCSILCIKLRKRKVLLLYLFCLLPLFVRKNRFQMTFLDVGQGDGIVIQNHNGNSYMIDGGSTSVQNVGEKRLIPFLKSHGIARIQCAFITHADTDHLNGVKEILWNMPDGKLPKRYQYSGDILIEMLCLPRLKEYNETYQELILLAKKKGVKLYFMGTGDQMIDEGFVLRSLSPGENADASDTNAHSLVFHLSYGDFDALLTGDMEGEGELMVMEELKKLKTRSFEVLKVSHHGSKYSTSDIFLKIVEPKYGFISCSKNNFYGHPHDILLQRLERIKCNVYITAEKGAIEIQTDGQYMKIKGFHD